LRKLKWNSLKEHKISKLFKSEIIRIAVTLIHNQTFDLKRNFVMMINIKKNLSLKVLLQNILLFAKVATAF